MQIANRTVAFLSFARGVSPICAAAVAQILQGFICQRVETTRGNILLNLAVPLGAVILGEPPSKLREFAGGKPADRVLNLFDGAHGTKFSFPAEWAQLARPYIMREWQMLPYKLPQ